MNTKTTTAQVQSNVCTLGKGEFHKTFYLHTVLPTYLHSSMHTQNYMLILQKYIPTGTTKMAVNKIPEDLHTQLLTASKFLMSFNRGIIPVLGDGNCLFRALSRLLFDSEDWHAFVRQQLVEFESLNSSLMQSYCDGNVSNHIAKVKYLTIWGTHVELVAAASLLKMTIYVCTQKCGNGEYYWEIFKPIENSHLRFSESLTLNKPVGIDHFEICHTMRCHYDIITMSDGLRPINPPKIQLQHHHISLLLP